jgi:hypothetical protein
MLAVRGRRASHRVRQVSRGCEGRLRGVDPAGSRAVTSCSSQPLPSGSLNVAKEP